MSNDFTLYFNRVSEALLKTDLKTMEIIASTIINTKITGKRVFTAGNGGSGATASHFCNDLIKGCRIYGRKGFKAMCLSDSMPVLTCLANDFNYESAYAITLETHAGPGDVLVAFSGSGNSPNILAAIKMAKDMGLRVIGIGGRDGGKMKDMCDICLIAPSNSMEELEDLHLCYCHSLVTYIRDKLFDIWDIETIKYPPPAGFTCALFDFDGTVSLLREGWQEVMVSYFTEVIAAVTPDGDINEIEKTATEFIDMLTGKQTIFQCMRLDEEVQKRGSAACDPFVYKAEYLRRLMDRIKNRHTSIKEGKIKPSEFLVPGITDFLDKLKQQGIKIYLASGTDEADVIAEAELLGVAHYFDGGIYGAKDDMIDCSKELVIKQILQENNIAGPSLISFGDGYVEVELVKDMGGYAIAVATDEARKKGINLWKRDRLCQAGAGAVIPDFSNADILMGFIIGAKSTR